MLDGDGIGIRVDYSIRVTAGLILLGWYWVLVDSANDTLYLALVAATLAVVLAYGLARPAPRMSVASLVLSLAGIAVAVAHASQQPAVLSFLIIPVLVTGALLSPAAGAAYGVGVTVAAYLFGPGNSWLLYVLAPCLAGLYGWVLLRPLWNTLTWSWRSSMEKTRVVDQLRDQQAKLARTVKDLKASYYLLEETNRQLALARQEADMLRDLRGRFATNLSHELRTPLNIILGFSQLIYRNPHFYGYDNWSDSLRRDLGQMQRNVSYLTELVDDIVDLARVDALAMPLRREPTDLRKLVEETLETARSLASDKELQLTSSLPDSLPRLNIDPIRIRQVLFNIVTNAIRYTERGHVTCFARRHEDEVLVSVADTGCGIPPDQLETVFNEFYQVGGPKEGPESGKGLGLAIAKRFVQLHGGRIYAQSELGKGTIVTFSLPVGSKSVALGHYGRPAHLPEARGRPLVLVAHDDGTTAGYLRRRIESHEFVAVEKPAELPELAQSLRPTAIIVSNVAGFNSHDSEQLRRSLPDAVPLIECPLPGGHWLGEHGDFNAVLTKPVSSEDIVAALAKVLHDTRNPTVLVVDDSRGFVQLVSRTIEEALGTGCRALASYSGDDALHKARLFRPDAVLLDLVMPGMTGFEVAHEMRKDPVLQATPIIAVTAATPGEESLSVNGATFTLAKKEAFRPGELFKLICAALDQAGPQAGVKKDIGEAPPQAVPGRMAS